MNFVAAKGQVAWLGTDKGLSVTDGTTWVNYRATGEKGGTIEIHRPGSPIETRKSATSLSNNFILGTSITDDEVWLATSHGLTRGVFAKGTAAATPTRKSGQGAGK